MLAEPLPIRRACQPPEVRPGTLWFEGQGLGAPPDG